MKTLLLKDVESFEQREMVKKLSKIGKMLYFLAQDFCDQEKISSIYSKIRFEGMPYTFRVESQERGGSGCFTLTLVKDFKKNCDVFFATRKGLSLYHASDERVFRVL